MMDAILGFILSVLFMLGFVLWLLAFIIGMTLKRGSFNFQEGLLDMLFVMLFGIGLIAVAIFIAVINGWRLSI